MENTTLYFKQGGSDKVYQAKIEPEAKGFVVRFAFGRRGTTLQTGTKTAIPVSYDHAKEIYNKLVKEKLAKGYTPGEDGTPYQGASTGEGAGILPQLLNPIEASDAAILIVDSSWCIQEKFDGKRTMIKKTATEVKGINRSGLFVALPVTLVQEISQISHNFIIDGECLGDKFVAFDLIELNETDYAPLPYLQRLNALGQVIPVGDSVVIAETAFETSAKAKILGKLRADHKEGAVFKRITAPYKEGRPASGGDSLKLKFYETASFLVTGINRQRSVNLGLLRDGALIPAGRVTIPPNYSVPQKGAIVEVRYLYAFPESGSIYQPVYLGERADIAPDKCTVAQLKYKDRTLKEAA